MNEQELCKKRLIDLSKQAYRKGIVLFSDFLNLNELNIYHQCEGLLETRTESSGGIPFAERQIIAFIPDAFSYAQPDEWKYPIAVLELKPVYPKFAEQLGHRDILGALMNLGIDRSKIGDILVQQDRYYIFCEESMAEYLIEQVQQIKHTVVTLQRSSADGLTIEQKLLTKEGIITSNRLDSVLACVYKLSRGQALSLICAEKVFVNGKSSVSSTYSCKEGDIISLRGYGRFIFAGEIGKTGKERLKIKYQLYQT